MRGIINKKSDVNVSVIMPVFNKVLYLREAIESWLRQTMEEKELICVDDGSTDGSSEILSEYDCNYENIYLIKMSENAGPGKARNKGLDFACGKYISFLDADDWYSADDALERIYQAALEDECDVAGGMLQYESMGKRRYEPRFRNYFNEKRNEIDLTFAEIQDDFWFTTYIYKREMILEKNLKFMDIRKYEDPPFCLQALHCANLIRLVNVEFYTVRVDAVRPFGIVSKNIKDVEKGVLQNLEFANTHKYQALKEKIIDRFDEYSLSWLGLAGAYHDREFEDMLLMINMYAMQLHKRLNIVDYLFYNAHTTDTTGFYLESKRLERHGIKGKCLILFGIGNYGRRIIDLNEIEQFFKLVLLVDTYRAGTYYKGYYIDEVEHIMKINESEYDYIMLASEKNELKKEMQKQIEKMGISHKILRT